MANACPSGALSKELKDINDARMGLAVLLDHETLLKLARFTLYVCYRVCPLVDKAITLERIHNDRTGFMQSLFQLFTPMLAPDAVNANKLVC